VIKGIHGRIGDFIFRGSANGETVFYKAPEKKQKKSKKAQKSRQQQLMLEAHNYADAAMADPETRAHYEHEALRKGKKAYWMAVSNYFKVHRQLGE
jgi:hypothetical protein